MAQPQIHHRPSTVNVARSRRAEWDLGHRPGSAKNNDQPNHRSVSRPGSSNSSRMEVGGQPGYQHAHNMNSTTNGQAELPKHPGEKMETFADSEIKEWGYEREQLLCLTACLIGQLVEVQVKNGSIYSGVFHTANAEKDYGVVLKVARLVREASSRKKHDAVKESTKKPFKTLAINGKDLVQIIAKDVPMSGDILQNGWTRENRVEIVTDSFLSESRHGEVERELKPWTPDKDDANDAGLESTFHNTWNRNWDQFEINKALFGVESTFDEEMYTTKLERGPQMREREREALRIAREIEGQSTKKLHLAEECGAVHAFEDLDEESRFSSVLRSSVDVGEDDDDRNLDIHNDDTFGNADHRLDVGTVQHNMSLKSIHEVESVSAANRPYACLNEETSSTSSGMAARANDTSTAVHKEKVQNVVAGDPSKHVMKVVDMMSPLASPAMGDTNIQALNLDPGCPQITEDVYREFNEFRQQENAKRGRKQREDQVNELKSFSESLKDLTVRQPTLSAADGTRRAASASPAFAPVIPPVPASTAGSSSTMPEEDAGTGGAGQVQRSSSPEDAVSSGASQVQHISSPGSIAILTRVTSNEMDCSSSEASSTSGSHASSAHKPMEVPVSSSSSSLATILSSTPSLAVGLSAGANSTKRSYLNPNAKEFRLNPNAKSFTPSFTPIRPPSPVVPGSVYVPGVVSPVAPLQTPTVSPLLPPTSQPAAKYVPYNPVAAATSMASPYMPSPGTYTSGVLGASVPPPGQSAIKVPPQVQQPVAGHSYGSQQPIRYASQAPAVQATSTYVHPSGHLYSQHMMYGQPGQVVYIQPYPQGPPMAQPAQAAAAASQQPQPKHRAPGGAGVQLCVAPPYIATGQQHFLPHVQVPQPSAPVQLTPGVLAPATISAMQPPQGVIGGMVTPAQPSSGANVMRIASKVGVTFQP